MKKRLLATILSLTMTMSMLVGCGAAETGENVEGAASEQAQETATTNEEITITMMVSGTASENDFETEQLPELIKAKFPNINLEVTKLPDDQYYTTLKTKLASGECPDIVLVQPKYAGSNSVIGLAEAGYLMDISDLNAVKLAGAAAEESFTYDGKVYAVAQGVSILGTYYNKDIFAQYGLEVPTTWDEFLNVCETLKSNGVQPIVMGDKDAYVMQFGLYQLAANEIYSKDAAYDDKLRTGETKFTDEGTWDKVISMYASLYENGYVNEGSLGLGASQAIQEFVDGKAAMTFDGNFNAAALTAQGAAEFERGYFPLPGTGSEVYASMAPGAGPAIYAGTDYPEECKAILEYWFDGESDVYKAFAETGRWVITYGYGADMNDPLFDSFIELYNEGKAFYWCNQAWPAGTETEMQNKFAELIGGLDTTAEDVAEGMQMMFDSLLEEKQ